ncbi:MAG TPA: Ig-like domain-containing protein [Burkholderiaceae bacterium]|nr:Ig-like domain-containing protein [Burkholderiaceae bacterium]
MNSLFISHGGGPLPLLGDAQVEQLLYSTAIDLGTPGWDPYYGHGRVDAAAAVQAALDARPFVDTVAPSVTIVSPNVGGTVSGLVPVDVSAADDVAISHVELSVNGTVLASDSVAPFAFSWDSTGVANGMANLVAVAFDAAGNSTTSSSVAVNVANASSPPPAVDTTAPSVMIVNPVAGAVSGTVAITLNASDDGGSAAIALSIYVDGRLLASGHGATLSANWNTKSKSVSAGEHTITATAVDGAGHTASAAVGVIVVKDGGGGGKGKRHLTTIWQQVF